MTTEWTRGEFTISTDPRRIDLDLVHRFLTMSYWAEGITRELVERSIRHSLCFGLYRGAGQIGVARVISDQLAGRADVGVLRGQGLGRWLMEVVHTHPDLQGFRRWVLLTRDAQALYRPFGYTPLARPDRYMEKWTPDVYRARHP